MYFVIRAFVAYFERMGYENVPYAGKFLHDLALDHYFFRNYDEVIGLMETSAMLPEKIEGAFDTSFSN